MILVRNMNTLLLLGVLQASPAILCRVVGLVCIRLVSNNTKSVPI
jgi:hypothetical protein